MKTAQSFLLLIFLNIATLLGMAGIIYYLGQTKQNNYEQIDSLIHLKSLITEKDYMEHLQLNNVPFFENTDRLDLEMDRYGSLLNPDLPPGSSQRYGELAKLLSHYRYLVNSVLDVHKGLQTRLVQIDKQGLYLESEAKELINRTEAAEDPDQLKILYQLTTLYSGFTFRETLPYNDTDKILEYSNNIRMSIADFEELSLPSLPADQKKNLIGAADKYYALISEFQHFLASEGQNQKDNVDELYEKNDELLLLTENLISDLNSSIDTQESRENHAILSGIMILVFISIWANAFLGRSISRPIDRLGSYVRNVTPENLSERQGIGISDYVGVIHNQEIAQLAESYIQMEDALFGKMSELKERSVNLSNELKERRKTERKLKQTEKYLNNILQSLNSLIITADSDLKLTHTNKLADELGENEGSSLFNRFPSLKNFEKEIREVLNSDTPWSKTAIVLKGWEDRYYNISVSPLAGVKTKGIVIRLDDVTRIRKIEDQLAETQKWETLGLLTSGFAHDFNNVLTGIVTSSSILLHKAESRYTDLDDSFMECLKIIDHSGNRAAAMVQQLLSLSKNNELNFSPINLKQSLEEVRSICRNSFDKSVSFDLEQPGEEVTIIADSPQIEQIFLNLCINSYHAMTDMRDNREKRGGKLKVTLKKIRIDKNTRFEGENPEPGEYAAVTISDNGVGIPKENRKRIFDPFFTTKEKTRGTGLGLAMVRHTVQQHKGFITLYSEVGYGTVITVYLPAEAGNAGINDNNGEKRELISGKGTILVIDDEETLRILSRSILEECGYEVLVAEDGFKGVDVYREKGSRIDLVILDMSMPGISGKETFIELKQINPEIRILLASGFIKDDRIQDLLNLGLEDFIQKPFDIIELSEKVSRILES